jgi:hypothetical protein
MRHILFSIGVSTGLTVYEMIKRKQADAPESLCSGIHNITYCYEFELRHADVSVIR